MKKRFERYIVFILLITTTVSQLSAKWNAKLGEQLTYKVSFSSMLTGSIKGGNATLSLLPNTYNIDNKEAYHAILKGETSGIVEWFYTVNNSYQSYMNVENMHPLLYIQEVRENSYSKNDTVIFDHRKEIAKYAGKTYKIFNGTNDLVSMIYYVRGIDFSQLKAGDIFSIPLYVGEKSIKSKVKYIGIKAITTPFGTKHCYGVQPEVVKGKVFKDNYPATLWITADNARLPMLVNAKMRVGRIKLELNQCIITN